MWRHSDIFGRWRRWSTRVAACCLVFTLLAVTRVAFADVCVDFDNGNSPGVRGAVEVAGPSGIAVKHWDSCSGNTLTEQVCVTDPTKTEVGERLTPDGERRTVSIECPGGCVNGACVNLPGGCVDTDKANDPLKRGIVRVHSQTPGRTVTTAQEDQCTVGGKSVREYGCMGSRIVQLATRDCRHGCIEGRCVVPGESAEGCFIAVKVEEKPTSDNLGSVFKVLGVRSVVGRHFGDVVEKNDDDSGGISLDVFDASGKLLKRYSVSTSVYAIGETVGPSATTIVIPSVEREIYIPFDSLIVNAEILSGGQKVPITINRSALVCARDCLLPNESWNVHEGIRQCCPGATKSFFNPSAYVCVGCEGTKGKGCPNTGGS